jgi:hypothetical protein
MGAEPTLAGGHDGRRSSGWHLSDESKQLAQAIRMLASPAPNVTRTDHRLLRVVVWLGCLLWCGLVWTTVAYLAAGAPPW